MTRDCLGRTHAGAGDALCAVQLPRVVKFFDRDQPVIERLAVHVEAGLTVGQCDKGSAIVIKIEDERGVLSERSGFHATRCRCCQSNANRLPLCSSSDRAWGIAAHE